MEIGLEPPLGAQPFADPSAAGLESTPWETRPPHAPAVGPTPRQGLQRPFAAIDEIHGERWRAIVCKHYECHDWTLQRNWLRYYHTRIRQRLTTLIPPGARVLDAGCGTGDVLAGLRPCVGVGIDLSSTQIAEARRRHQHLRFHCLPMERAAELGDAFDYVVLCQTVGEVYCLQSALDALRGVCHDRTRLVIVHYNRLWQPAIRLMEKLGLKPRSPEQNWLPADEIAHLLRLSGFDPVRTFGMTPFPLRVPLASGLLNRIAGNLPVLQALGLNSVVVARCLKPRVHRSNQAQSLSIVVPARNEAGNIPNILRRIPNIAPRQEIIFVEGGSTDGTWETIRRECESYQGSCIVKCLQQTGKGKGDAVRTGFAVATGDILAILDADLSVPPEELPQFIAALQSQSGECINGSRMVYLMDDRAMRFLNILGNKVFGWLFTYLLSQPFRDTLCGTKVLLRDDYERIAQHRSFFGEFDPFGDFDLLFGAARLSLKIVDVPVHYKARIYGETNISRFQHGWLLLRMCSLAARKLKFI